MFHYKNFALFICQVDINYVLEELDTEVEISILLLKSVLSSHTAYAHILEAKLFFSPLWSDL